jgi:type II secretory pathway component PulF
MFATNAFFIWFFMGLNGLGGWIIFLLLALAAVVWIFYDSSKRKSALAWTHSLKLFSTWVCSVGSCRRYWRLVITSRIRA